MAHCGYSESIYVFSGVTENGLSTSFDMFNLTSNTWTSLYSYSYESPYLRSSAIMFQYQSHYIYLVGGLTDYGPINDIWRYSINLQLVFTIQWENINYSGHLPRLFLAGHTAIYENFLLYIYIYGGKSVGSVSNELYM